MDIKKQTKQKEQTAAPVAVSVNAKKINSPHVLDLTEKPETKPTQRKIHVMREHMHYGLAILGLAAIAVWVALVATSTSLARFAPAETTTYIEVESRPTTTQTKRLAAAIGIDAKTVGDFLLGIAVPDFAGHGITTAKNHFAIAYTNDSWLLIAPSSKQAFDTVAAYALYHGGVDKPLLREVVLGENHYFVAWDHGILFASPNEALTRAEVTQKSHGTPQWYRGQRAKLGLNAVITAINNTNTAASFTANAGGLGVEILNADRYTASPANNTIPNDVAGAFRGASLLNDITNIASLPSINTTVVKLVPQSLLEELSTTERQEFLKSINKPYVVSITPNTEQGRFDVALRLSGTQTSTAALVTTLTNAFARSSVGRTAREITTTLPDGTQSTEYLADENLAKPEQQVYHGVTINTYDDRYVELAYGQSGNDLLFATSNVALQKLIDTEIGSTPAITTSGIPKKDIVVSYIAPKTLFSLAGQFLGELPAKEGSNLYTFLSTWQKGLFWVDDKHQNKIHGQLSQ